MPSIDEVIYECERIARHAREGCANPMWDRPEPGWEEEQFQRIADDLRQASALVVPSAKLEQAYARIVAAEVERDDARREVAQLRERDKQWKAAVERLYDGDTADRLKQIPVACRTGQCLHGHYSVCFRVWVNAPEPLGDVLST